MPVPVPRLSKPVAHPVIKKTNCSDSFANSFQNITRTLPVSPTGPPPSFGTREQWINSLPSWRRTKPRRIWEDDARLAEQRAQQDFSRGLTIADNASVIKGAHAEACIPPLYTLLSASGLPPVEESNRFIFDGEVDDEMSPDGSAMDQGLFDHESQWSASSPVREDNGMIMDQEFELVPSSPGSVLADLGTFQDQVYERGAFTPIFEDESPGTGSGRDAVSSPLEPLTPFGEFVDRVVSAQPYTGDSHTFSGAVGAQEYSYPDNICGQCHPTGPTFDVVPEYPKEPEPAQEVITPSATTSYRKLAEPLSDWVVNYVWKVCTTGFSLPAVFSPSAPNQTASYAPLPPSYLAASVQSLLLSTLLQPSAVLLAIWYIVKLPVCFGATGLGLENVKELRFRAALLGDGQFVDKEAMEASAPFRLIVLGCMLANKWLDDHTFSNKTWHTISNVPIHALNKLESLALDIFAYDLSVPSHSWSQWLSHVMSYHLSLSSPVHPQPIGRPSTNPHSIVRKAIEEIIQAPVVCDSISSLPQPVFLGLEERRRERLEKEQALNIDVLEIDLDEDGPLREEYLPRRRTSGAGPGRKGNVPAAQPVPQASVNDVYHWESQRLVEMEKPLPPPAKWSPAGDEPIFRDRNRVTGHYVAVQPPLMTSYPPYQPHDIGYPVSGWHTNGGYVAMKPQSTTGYIFDLPPLHHTSQTAYNPYPYVPHIALSHSRSHSLSYDQDNSQSHHLRSYSQSRFDYRYSMSNNELGPPSEADSHWAHYPYLAPGFAPPHSIGYQPIWLRT